MLYATRLVRFEHAIPCAMGYDDSPLPPWGCPRFVAVLSRSSLGGWRQSDPVMAPAHVLTGGRLIERIYSPVADGLPRERQ